MQRFVVLLACFLCVASTAHFVAADKVVSCVALPNYFTPGYTYKIEYTKDAGECCKLCAYDKHCVVWSREEKTGLCALKDDSQWFMGALGVVSGVKYESYATPGLIKNGVHAYVLIGKDVVKPVVKSTVVSASASATSYGGTSVSSASASPYGSSTYQSVSGSGSAHAKVETPQYSLATSVTKEHYKPPKHVVAYYKKPTLVAEVTLITGKVVPVIIAADKELTCYRCNDFPCFVKKALSYKYYGKVIKEYLTESDTSCCTLCKWEKLCLSWWRDSKTKKCVLNSNVPKPTVDHYVTGGAVL